MPIVDHKLASQRLQVQGGNRGLNPVLFDTSAAARIRAPQIDPNAANVQFTPVQPGRVGIKTPLEATAEGASKLMEVWGNAATQYADRQATVEASQAMAQAKGMYQRLLHGTTGDDGKYVPGYLGTKFDDAVKVYTGTIKQMQDQQTQILQQLSPAARAKAAVPLMELYDSTFAQVATHRNQEFGELEKRSYNQKSEHESESIAVFMDTTAAAAYQAYQAGDTEAYTAIAQQIEQRIDAAVQRRYAGIHNAPADADPANDAVVDIYKSILARPQGITKALAYKPILDTYVTSTDAVTAIDKAFNDARERSLKELEYGVKIANAQDAQRALEYRSTLREIGRQSAIAGAPIASLMPEPLRDNPDAYEEAQGMADLAARSKTNKRAEQDIVTIALREQWSADFAETEINRRQGITDPMDDKYIMLSTEAYSQIEAGHRAGFDKFYSYYGDKIQEDARLWFTMVDKTGSTISLDSEMGKDELRNLTTDVLNAMSGVLQDPKATKADRDKAYEEAKLRVISGRDIDSRFTFEPSSQRLPAPAHLFNLAEFTPLADQNIQEPLAYYSKLKEHDYISPKYIKDPSLLEQIKLIMDDPRTDEQVVNAQANAVVEAFLAVQRTLLEQNEVSAAAMQRWTGADYQTLMLRFFNDVFTGQRKTFRSQTQEQMGRMKNKMQAGASKEAN